jgi:hypothetical protein
MNTPALIGRRRPGHVWAAIEICLAVLMALVLVTVTWFNDPHSLGRLGLMIGSWSVATYVVWRSIRTRQRGAHSA